MKVHVSANPAAAAAEFISERVRDAVEMRGAATFAVSGGSTAPAIWDSLLDLDVPWSATTVWQVDERIAPDGDPDRNAEQLHRVPATVSLMPVAGDDSRVSDSDLDLVARRYGDSIVDPLDVVHLGVGDDGHTASWPPAPHPDADSALSRSDRAFTVALFNGRRRMTLGPSVVNAARCRVVVAAGLSKAPVLARWLSARSGEAHVDPTLPIAAIEPAATFVFLDENAASLLAGFGAAAEQPAADYGRHHE